MSSAHNTLFLRLAGPMQSWGTSSRFQLRRTDAYPSKSGVLGLLLCAAGISRKASLQALDPHDPFKPLGSLASLAIGVRVDRAGTLDWDYHTAGAKIGIRRADGEIKKTASTGEYETVLSSRQYLYDASFLVALQGETDTINACARALDNPIWPVFLGRKCCVPAEPIFTGTNAFDSLTKALSSVPWRARVEAIDRDDRNKTRTLFTFIEHLAGSPTPDGARLVYDVPRAFGYHNHGARWVVPGQVTVAVEKPTQAKEGNRHARPDLYGPEWDSVRIIRLNLDNHLCVFCKSPAVDVHHLDYDDVRPETLRSLCKICHDACTMLEYGQDMRTRRIDPADPEQRPAILRQIGRLLVERRLGRRRELLETARTVDLRLFDDLPDSLAREGH